LYIYLYIARLSSSITFYSQQHHTIKVKEITTMSTSSLFTGILIGSTATAFIVYYFLTGTDEKDDDDSSTKKSRKHKFMDRIISRQQSRKSIRRVSGRYNPETSFFTDVVAELWPYIKVAAADKVQQKVEPYFASMPTPMNTCKFVKVDLGNTPFTMNNIVVRPIQNGTVQWDFDYCWDGECHIELQADYVGKFGVKKLKIFGRMAIIMKPLTNELPVVSAIQYSFINMPRVDLNFTGLASVAELGVLNDSIKGVIQKSLVGSCLPCRRLYKVAHDNNYLDTYLPPVGTVRVAIESGRGFVVQKHLLAKDDVPDVYLNITLGASSNVWRTETVTDDCNPKWNACKDFILWDREQEINIKVRGTIGCGLRFILGFFLGFVFVFGSLSRIYLYCQIVAM
jgi:hypothetical protein